MVSAQNADPAASIALIGNISPAFLRNALITLFPYQHETKIHTALLPERKNQMENKIEVFQNEQFGAVRITLIDGEPWFAASDVCKALEIKNAPQALSRLEEDERFTTIISNDSAASGKSKLSFVNEAGLYSLILSSRKPEAKAFKRWVTHEVIPAIRKTGGYLSEPLLQRIQNDPAVIFEFADALLAERRRATALEAELSKAKPKADYFDAFINPDDCTNIRTTAKELKIPERKFVQFLLKEKFLFRSPSGQLLPYNKHSNEGLFIVRDFVTFSFTGSQTYPPRGLPAVYAELRRGGFCRCVYAGQSPL